MEQKYLNYLKYAILLISVSSVLQWLKLSIGNTLIWWSIDAFIIFCFYKLMPDKQEYRPFPIHYWFILLSLNIIYSFFMAENYWDWKSLISNIMVFSMPVIAIAFYKPENLSPILNYWFKRGILLFIVLAPFMLSDAFGRFLVPFSFIALFFPTLSKTKKILVLIAYLITLRYGVESRSDIIKFTICILLAFIAHWDWFLNHSINLLRFFRIIGFSLPIILLVLGFTGVFNIFQIQNELGWAEDRYTMTNTETGEKVVMTTDTRTFLYIEEAESAIKHNYVIQGRSMARGFDSPFFAWMIDEQMYGDYHPSERYKSEVSIHNVFNYFGLIGVFLYFLIFWKATGLAINESNNIYVKIIGLYIIFRWIFAFVEDFSRFDLNMFFLWTMIGICYSPHWRNMSNDDFKEWVNSI